MMEANRVPEWLRPDDGNRLFGIEAIARYLGLPFLDVRTMIGAGHLPTERAGRAHASSRATLARLVMRAEAGACGGRPIAPAPDDVGPDGIMGLVKGWAAIGARLGVTATTARHHGTAGRLPAFAIGACRFARAASLDAFAAERGGDFSSAPLADADTIVGVEGIAAFLAVDILTARDWVRLGHVPTFRTRHLVCARRTELVAHFLELERRSCAAEFRAPPPRNLAVDDPVGIVRGAHAIGAGCGLATTNVQYHAERKGLPTFYVGRMRTARRASLNLYARARAAAPAGQRQTGAR